MMQKERAVVVAGNGESLKNINYDALPDSFDVFRCNQFYFENSYFLGEKVKKAFFTPFMTLAQYYTYKHLTHRQEYDIESMVASSFGHSLADGTEKYFELFSDVENGYDKYLSKLKEFDAFLRFNDVYFRKRITSGVYMCAAAIAEGYQDIYLVGIDFYKGNNCYAFEHNKQNISQLVHKFSNQDCRPKELHFADYDLEALLFLKEKYNVNFYCISDSSPLIEFFRMPNIEHRTSNIERLCKKKDKDATLDILLPPKEVYLKLAPPQTRQARDKLYQNWLFKLFFDIFQLPKQIKRYVKEKKEINN